MGKEYPVQSTGRTMELVAELVERGSAGVTELAEALELSKGAVHNHLRTLEELEFVVRDDDGYRVGSGFLDLGTLARRNRPLYRESRAEVTRLARASGEVAALVAQEHGQAAYVFVAGDEENETTLRDGLRRPLDADAAGRAILAHRPTDELEAVIENRETSRRSGYPGDRRELVGELRTIRDQGLAFEREGGIEGLQSVAAPLTTEEGLAVGAITVAGPANRMTGKRLEEDIAGLVVSSANSISVELFY